MPNYLSTSKKALSYIERRLNYINRILGARIDVKTTMKSIERARGRGYQLTIDRVVSAVGDLRRKSTRQSGAAFLRYQWNDLAMQNNYTENILTALENGAYVNPGASVIYYDVSTPQQQQWMSRDPRTGAVTYLQPGEQPAAAIKLTPQLANRILADHAEHLHDRQNKNPASTSYREI